MQALLFVLVCSFCLCLSVSFFACFFVIAFEYMTLPRFACAFSLCFSFVCYAIVFAPCSGNAERQKQHHGQSIAERRQGERLRRACFACRLPLLSVHTISLCAGFACRGIDHRPPGVLFRYGWTGGKRQIRLAHPPNLLF